MHLKPARFIEERTFAAEMLESDEETETAMKLSFCVCSDSLAVMVPILSDLYYNSFCMERECDRLLQYPSDFGWDILIKSNVHVLRYEIYVIESTLLHAGQDSFKLMHIL